MVGRWEERPVALLRGVSAPRGPGDLNLRFEGSPLGSARVETGVKAFGPSERVLARVDARVRATVRTLEIVPKSDWTLDTSKTEPNSLLPRCSASAPADTSVENSVGV